MSSNQADTASVTLELVNISVGHHVRRTSVGHGGIMRTDTATTAHNVGTHDITETDSGMTMPSVGQDGVI
jgi:hypothetical protein